MSVRDWTAFLHALGLAGAGMDEHASYTAAERARIDSPKVVIRCYGVPASRTSSVDELEWGSNAF